MARMLKERGGELLRRVNLLSERELAASLLGAIAIGGPVLGFATFALPHPEGTDYVLPAVSFGIAILLGLMLWVRRATIGWATIAAVVAVGAVIVTAVMFAVPGRSAVYVTYYVWLGIFAFYFFRPRWAFAQTAWIAVLYAVAVADDNPPGALEQWAVGVATILGVGILVLALRMRIAGLLGTLEAAAATDDLTGLPNRRAFDQQLLRELERSEREGSDVSLALLDLDRFKTLNDTAGHAAGDQALRDLATVIRAAIRGMDWPARIGGDEFVVLLPGATVDEAMLVATRLLAAVDDSFGAASMSLQASIGVASADGRAIAPDVLLAEADRALYLAKRAGGDCVSQAEPLDRSPVAHGGHTGASPRITDRIGQ